MTQPAARQKPGTTRTLLSAKDGGAPVRRTVLPGGLRVVTVAGDLYGAMVAGGIVFAFLFQIFVNVGMTMGIAPVTGIPLPFVTVGGSSMVANLVAIGVLQAIHARGRPDAFR